MSDNDILGIDIPISKGEVMWTQRIAEERVNGKYKVSYYNTGQFVCAKWFDTFKEATDFSVKVKTGDVLEVKWYPNES